MAELRTIIRGLGAQLLVLLSWAGLSALAYPRPNLWVLAYFSLVPLVLLGLRGEPRRRVALLTYLVSTLWWAGMIWWIYPVTGPGFFALAAYMGLYPLAFVLLLPLVQRRFNLPLMLSVPILWVGLEWLRGAYVMTGFPWFLQGQSQPVFVIQIADLFGVYGVSFFVCMVNGFIADFLTRPLLIPRAGKRAAIPIAMALRIAIVALLIVLTVGYGVHRVGETGELADDPERPTMRIAVVQTNVPQSNKTHPTDEQDATNFEQMIRLSEQALQDNPDLIVWPETMVPRAINRESVELFEDFAHYRGALDRFIEQHGVPMLVGSHAYAKWSETAERFHERYNSAYLLMAQKAEQRYDKVHRVPYGEYLPFVEGRPWARDLLLKLTPYDFDYSLSPGREFKVFELEAGGKPWRVAAPICFEDVVTYVPRKMVWDGKGKKRVDVLVNLSNDGWFAGTAEGPQHEQIARFRCVENRVPMARAVNTGVSGFIDSAGRVIARVRDENGRLQAIAGTDTATVMRDGRITLYSIVSDSLPVGCVVASFVLLGIAAADRFTQRKKTRWDQRERSQTPTRV